MTSASTMRWSPLAIAPQYSACEGSVPVAMPWIQGWHKVWMDSESESASAAAVGIS